MFKQFIALGTLVTLAFMSCHTRVNAQSVQLQLSQAVTIQSAEDLIANHWRPEQHLYVKGDLGIGQQQLADLEAWLDEHAPHWTIVLMDQVDDERYQSLDNRAFRGMDAVEYALGRGLALRTSFSELVDERTGETDGAVFVLFLREGKFSYYGSEAQDVRSLGESHWVGELDRPAFRAMRGGGRILDAVKGTVTNVNSRLSQTIAAEAEQVEREQRARQRAYVNLKTDIAKLNESIAITDAKASELKTTYPNAKGELTTPPTEAWRRQLAETEGNLTEDNVATTTKQFHDISHQVEAYLNSYAEYEIYDATAADLEGDIGKLRSHAITVARPMANLAKTHLAEAHAARSQGDRGLATIIEKARDAVSQGRQAVADEQARLARATARRRLIGRTIMITAVLLTFSFLGVLAWLNRRRVPALQRARSAFAETEESVRLEMERVYGLFERSGEILGSKEKVKKRGYEGVTKKLTENTFEDVDDLIVMSTEVERVIGEAREMIHPQRFVGKISNMFSGSKYEQGVNHISGKPLKFHRDKGLPLVIQRESERTGAEPPEEVTMTFDQVFAAFHDRTATAEDTLNTVEGSLLQVDDQLKLLQAQIERATVIDRELAAVADDDGLFALPAFFEKLIPSAQADFDEADEITLADPVQAIQEQIPRGARKMTDALAIAATVQHARKEIFPQLNEVAPQLQELDYNTNWIQQEIGSLGEQANQLMEQAVVQTVASEATQFAQDTRKFGGRAQQTVELAKQLKQEAAPSLATLEQNIVDARKEIGAALGLPSDECLIENDAHPDARLAHGRKLLAAAQAALQHGGVEAATQARDTLNEEVTTGQALIDTSLGLLREFDSTILQRKQQLDSVSDKVPRHDQLLEEIRKEFASSALVLQAGDPSYEDPAATVDTHLAECRDSLADGQELIQGAAEKYRRGKLLEASGMLDLADGHVREADQLLAEIDQHCTKLHEVSRTNEGKLVAMQREANGLQVKISDRRTMAPTIREYQRVLGEIEVARSEILHTLPRDPFQDSAAIDTFSANVTNLAAKIEADLDAHAEAKRAVEGAKHERNIGEQLVHRSSSDGIPDSHATTASVQAIQRIAAPLEEVIRDLQGEHNDWKEVDHQAARIHSELSVENARLRGELDRAQRSVDLFQAASSTVFEATRWTGGFGTRIFGSPGSSELERARRALTDGDYTAMVELARAAQIAAQHAIQRAQREVYRKQREAARVAEAARRRRRQNSIQIGGSSLPSIGGRSSGGSSRGGGGSRSSGSGFSRSGW